MVVLPHHTSRFGSQSHSSWQQSERPRAFELILGWEKNEVSSCVYSLPPCKTQTARLAAKSGPLCTHIIFYSFCFWSNWFGTSTFAEYFLQWQNASECSSNRLYVSLQVDTLARLVPKFCCSPTKVLPAWCHLAVRVGHQNTAQAPRDQPKLVLHQTSKSTYICALSRKMAPYIWKFYIWS